MCKSTLACLAFVGMMSAAQYAHAASPPPGADAKLWSMLPKTIQESGAISVGSDPHNAPYVFYGPDNTTLVGLEQDLAAVMAKKLGVKFVFHPAEFASIITAVQADRFDMGISAFGDFVPREKIVDEIDYTYEGTGIIVPEGNPNHIQKISDACGHTAAAVQGSVPLELLDKQAGLCPADKPLTVKQFPSGDQSVLAVRSGRADLLMDTYGVTAYELQHQPANLGGQKLQLVEGKKYAVGYQAMIVGKDDPQLRDAIQATLESMLEDGSYAAIFKKWGLSANMLPKITINDAARFVDYEKLD